MEQGTAGNNWLPMLIALLVICVVTAFYALAWDPPSLAMLLRREQVLTGQVDPKKPQRQPVPRGGLVVVGRVVGHRETVRAGYLSMVCATPAPVSALSRISAWSSVNDPSFSAAPDIDGGAYPVSQQVRAARAVGDQPAAVERPAAATRSGSRPATITDVRPPMQ